jgi:hypothetical protein
MGGEGGAKMEKRAEEDFGKEGHFLPLLGIPIGQNVCVTLLSLLTLPFHLIVVSFFRRCRWRIDDVIYPNAEYGGENLTHRTERKDNEAIEHLTLPDMVLCHKGLGERERERERESKSARPDHPVSLSLSVSFCYSLSLSPPVSRLPRGSISETQREYSSKHSLPLGAAVTAEGSWIRGERHL